MSEKRTDSRDEARHPAELDDTDRELVELLRADGRASVRSLAEALHISRATAYARLDRLRSSGVVTGFSAQVHPERYGYGISAYVYLKISQHSWKAVRRRVQAIEEVWHAALVSGENDLILLVRTRDAASLRDLVLNELQTMTDVQSTQTVLILDEVR
ncbi:MAG: Lrp/AsnC family transcriptional regulator [Jatrophihabitans sp.]